MVTIGKPQTMKTADRVARPAPAAVEVEEIDDPTAVGAGIELVEHDAVQLQSMPLRARRVSVRLDDVAVLFHSTHRRIRTRARVRPGWVAWDAFGPRTRGTINGWPVRPGLVAAAEPGAEVDFVADAGWESVAFFVKETELAAQLGARRRTSELRRPRGVEILGVAPERGRVLFAWGKRFVEFAARQPGRFETGRPERGAAQAELIDTLLAAVATAGEPAPGPGDRSRRAQSLLVKRVEDFARSRPEESLHVGDLCRAVGVSERTLQYAFRRILDTTPMAHLLRLRLHRVRRALLAARRGSTTVSAAALDAGFWHFGEFSHAYRQCFGELPSETLRRRRGSADGGR